MVIDDIEYQLLTAPAGVKDATFNHATLWQLVKEVRALREKANETQTGDGSNSQPVGFQEASTAEAPENRRRNGW